MSQKWRWNTAQMAEKKWWQLYLKNKDVDTYLTWKKNYWAGLIDQCLQSFPLNPDLSILDAGCGPAGIFMNFSHHQDVVAFDPLINDYEKDLDHFKKTWYPNVQFVNEGIESFKWPYLFNRVFCMNAINHVQDIQLSFERICNLVKTDGYLVITIDAHNHRLFKSLFRLLPGDILHPHQYDLSEYKHMIEKNGLKIMTEIKLKSEFFFDHYLLIAHKAAHL